MLCRRLFAREITRLLESELLRVFGEWSLDGESGGCRVPGGGGGRGGDGLRPVDPAPEPVAVHQDLTLVSIDIVFLYSIYLICLDINIYSFQILIR